MSDNEDFEEIINNLGDADNDEEDFEDPLDIVANYWKAFNPGEIFVKGILIVESVKGNKKIISMNTTEGVSMWEAQGMLGYCDRHMVWSLQSDDEDDDDEGEDDE